MKKSLTLLSNYNRNQIFFRLSQKFPNPKSELDFTNPFELLCAVVLSAQATDASVNKVTPQLFSAAPNAEKMVELGEENIASFIKSIGLWKNKSHSLFELSKILIENFGGNVPQSYDDLIKLPGVGSKTAKVVLNVAFGQPTVAVDTHIFRVCNRTGLCPGKNVKEVEDNVAGLIDVEYLKEAHHYLLLHGRYVCKARNPDCNNCILNDLCLKISVK